VPNRLRARTAQVTVIVAYMLCTLCAWGAIILILEMDTPLEGIVKVSIDPMREALARLGT